MNLITIRKHLIILQINEVLAKIDIRRPHLVVLNAIQIKAKGTELGMRI